MQPPAVRTQGLTKVYRSALRRNSVRALDGLDLEVDPGEIFGLLGPNGAGKTTLIKVLLGIVRPTTGSAALFGRPVTQPEARARIGFLPEDHRFPSFLTAGEMLDLYGRMSGVSDAARRTRIPALLERVGMAKWRDTKIRKFSKGMVQRVGLAQALLNEPDLVFLDEPTDGVDPVGRREIRDLLLWLRKEGKTVFLNSHLLSEVEQVCTRVAILYEGTVVRQGTVAELTSVESVYEIAATPFPPALLERLGEQVTPVEAAPSGLEPALDHYRLRAATRSDLNALLDELRSEGVEIEAIQPLRRTLENYFIEVVQPVRGKGERASGREGEDFV